MCAFAERTPHGLFQLNLGFSRLCSLHLLLWTRKSEDVRRYFAYLDLFCTLGNAISPEVSVADLSVSECIMKYA